MRRKLTGIVASSAVLLASGLLAAAPARATSITVSDANCGAGVVNGTSFSATTGDVVTITSNLSGCVLLKVGTRLVTSASDIVATGTGVGTPTLVGSNYELQATSFTSIQITFTNTTSNTAGFGLGVDELGTPFSYGTRRTQWTVAYTGSGGGGGSSGVDAPAPQTFELSLNPQDGTRCSNSSQSGTSGTWLTLPSTNDCTPPVSRAGATLLGWSTSPDFPIAIAQRQVTNGWGTYETFNDAGRITSVFIPAGRATFISGTNTLYPIWNK